MKFKTVNNVLNSTGLLLYILGCILLIPLIASFIFNESFSLMEPFLIPSLISFVSGFLLRNLFKKTSVSREQAILICVLGWIIYSLIGGLCFKLSINASYLDGVFETMSGFTTTGITMFTGLSSLPKSLLLWRAITQWVGGLGILTFILAAVSLKGSEHRLFGAETHKIVSQRPKPGLHNTIKILWLIYISFTLMIMFLLFVSGVDFFDSLSHSLTCLSTGGYSTYDASIEHFRIIGHTNYILIEYIIILGMFLGGTNFFIHYHIINKNFKILKENTEFKYWVSIILIFISIIFLERIITKNIFNTVSIFSFDFFKILEQNFRIICFQTVSLLTTTGFGTKDINLVYFGSAAKQLFLVMMLIGGCVGSTGGGFKVLRIAILHKLIKRETNKMFYPRNSINYVIVDEQKVSYDEIYRIAGLLFIWILFLIIGGLITAYFSEYDPITCVSGMFSALGNIGPCYIPVNELGNLHPVIKITYILGMLAGRLEILPVLLFFRLKVWKK